MLLISDGNSEISAHLCSEIGSSICLGHLCISTAVENFEPGFEIDLFSFISAQRVLSCLLL